MRLRYQRGVTREPRRVSHFANMIAQIRDDHLNTIVDNTYKTGWLSTGKGYWPLIKPSCLLTQL